LRQLARAEFRRAASDGRACAAGVDAGDPEGADAESLRLQLAAQVEGVLDDLEQHGLLSDTRAADALVHAKSARFGNRRLRQALQARALPAELIESALRATRDTELTRALEVWQRRFGSPPEDARERARQMRFLLARGFDADVAQRVLRHRPDASDDTWADGTAPGD
jgi:regulatory protein